MERECVKCLSLLKIRVVSEDAGGQPAGHVRGRRGRAQSIPEIPPKPGELKTELLGLKARSSKVQTSQE